MRKRIAPGLLALAAGLALFTGLGDRAAARSAADKAEPRLIYGHDLPVRSGGTDEITAKTPRFGVDVYLDESLQATIALSQTGAIAVAPAEPAGMERGRMWVAAYDLAVRTSGEAEITQKTRKWGVELFRFPGSNQLIYASESGSIAFSPIPSTLGRDKSGKRSHRFDLKVREQGQESFNNAKRFGVEAYVDQNTDGLLYISETGSVAASAGSPEEGKKSARANPLYGLTLPVRRLDESQFSARTRKFAIEVFEDSNAGVILYVSETGSVACAPVNKTSETRGVELVKRISLEAHKAGDEDGDKPTKYAVEVFRDNRTENLVFITETGSLGVLAR